MHMSPSIDFRKFLIVCASFVISFITFGVARLAGQLFVACQERFNTGRKEASLPFVLCFTVRNLSGPVVGCLGNKCGLQLITLSGCLLAAISVGACYFVEDIVPFTVLWGGCYGLAFGMGSTLIPNILHLYFDKSFNKMHGIYQAGGCMGSLVLPAICEYLLENYGVSGTLLILSGLIFNCVPAAILLRNFPTSPKVKNYSKAIETEKILEIEVEKSTTGLGISGKKFCSPMCASSKLKSSAYDSDNKCLEQDEFSKSQYDFTEKCENERRCHMHHLESQSQTFPAFSKNHATNVCFVIATCESTLPRKVTIDQTTVHPPSENDKLETIQNNFEPEFRKIAECQDVSESKCQCCPISKLYEQICSFLQDFKILLDPVYILILMSMGVSNVVATTLYTVIVDACRDKGITEDVTVLMTFAVTDMLGRFFLAYAADEGYISQVNLYVLCCGCFGLVLIGLVWLKKFYIVLLGVAAIGVFSGGIIVVPMEIIRKYTHKDNMNMAFASRYILFAVLGFGQSPIIGYFRETLRSYDGLFYLMGSMCLLAALIASLIPPTSKHRNHRKERELCVN